jgi:hypothetical protein
MNSVWNNFHRILLNTTQEYVNKIASVMFLLSGTQSVILFLNVLRKVADEVFRIIYYL